DEGIVGIGEGTYSRKEVVVAKMVEALTEPLIGRDPFDSESIYYALFGGGYTAYHTVGVIFTSAISGIDQALWDIKGKALGVPVCALLGGPRGSKVPVYSHFGGKTPGALVDNARAVLAEGFTSVKSGITMDETKGPKI